MQTESHLDFEEQKQCGAILRSLSGESSAEIRDWQLFYKAAPYGALPPHVSLENLNQGWASKRGLLDGIALRLRYSDEALHHSLCPTGMIESFVFEVLEQIRAESICPQELKGAKQNIEGQFIAWAQHYMTTGGAESSIGMLLIALFMTAWMRLNAKEMPQLLQDMVEATRAGLAEDTGALLKQLKANRFCQEEYSIASLALAKMVSGLIEEEYRNVPSIRVKKKRLSDSLLQIEWVPHSKTEAAGRAASSPVSPRDKRLQLQKNLSQYIVFDRQYDIEIEAKKKIRPAQLAAYQTELSDEIKRRNIPWAKLTRLYKNLFSSPAQNGWQTTESEGLIDRRYLIRAATSPLSEPLFRHRIHTPETSAKISLLIDCSGSMKEQRLEIAVWIDSLVRILEQAKVQTEVLGYSTSTWQGGRPYKAWRRSGNNPNPGRLNERAHWIFKDFHTPWRKARAGISAILRPEIYAESIDGEALLWAAERLKKIDRGQAINKKLILFSDGCPMDRATIQANGEDYLKEHLLHSIAWCEQEPDIELWGCGIGHEMRSAFKRRLSWEIEGNQSAEILMNWAAEINRSKE